MTLDDWVLACRAEGYMPVLTAMRMSPGGPQEAPPVVGIEPAWLHTKYGSDDGMARFRSLLEQTWAAECVSWEGIKSS